MKFLIYDNNSEEIVARIEAANEAAICNPYSSIQYSRLAIPEEIHIDDANVDEELSVVEDQDLKDARILAEREAKLERLREARAPKLTRVDTLVNIAFVGSWGPADRLELKDYRQSLLDITEPYKADMSLIDALDIEAIEWPTEPTEG